MPHVLITGTSRGIGLEFARAYAEDGWTVHALARNPARGPQATLNIRHYEGDVTDQAAMERLALDLSDVSLDLVIANAGVYGPAQQTLAGMDYDAWAQTFQVNTIAPMRLIQGLVPHLARAKGRFVAISSSMASIAGTGPGFYAYRTSKAALNMLVRLLAQDLRERGVTTVALDPGWVRTDMGGPNAPLSSQESVEALRRTISTLTLEDSGKYLKYDGSPLAW
ncbi:SDR family oxidoreductase [Zavarzinia sp. CC-PAN008]|uniref:SDR family oxidoreductase n=1 Tax=Zavarzinia sp. CC-PAN008 TaxID=3243332 RepID=UPI003F7473C8